MNLDKLIKRQAINLIASIKIFIETLLEAISSPRFDLSYLHNILGSGSYVRVGFCPS